MDTVGFQVPVEQQRSIRLTIENIIMGVLIFSVIVVWFDFIEIVYTSIFPKGDGNAVLYSFGLTLTITIIIAILLFIIYKVSIKDSGSKRLYG